MVMLGRFSEMYIKFKFLDSGYLYLRVCNVLGRHNLACLLENCRKVNLYTHYEQCYA